MWTQEIVWIEPIAAAEHLADLPSLSLLDSAMAHPTLGRYSYLAADPFGLFTVDDGAPFWDGEPLPGAPLAALETMLSRYRSETLVDMPPFQGGAIGMFAYEFGWSLDHGPRPGLQPRGRTVHLAFYDTVIAFDHAQKRCWILATGWPAPSHKSRQRRAEARMAAFTAHLARGFGPPRPFDQTLSWHPDITRDAYCRAVERVKAYIRAGDIYQANIAQRFTAEVPPHADGLQLYKRLRDANPAPFAAYLRCGALTVLSSSPERFVQTRGRLVEARPIKGTARRSKDSATDDALARGLLRSAKDRAENVMIVDLLRNDLSRVCTPDTVDVPVLCGLETYEGVHHLVSVVTGTLRDGLQALDLVAAAFPGGSITGAPKRRAMEIISAIEGRPRGIYCGSIGVLGFDGMMDLNIAIRTIEITGDVASFQAGGGITILSDPDVEYEETLTKAHRIVAAFSGVAVDAVA